MEERKNIQEWKRKWIKQYSLHWGVWICIISLLNLVYWASILMLSDHVSYFTMPFNFLVIFFLILEAVFIFIFEEECYYAVLAGLQLGDPPASAIRLESQANTNTSRLWSSFSLSSEKFLHCHFSFFSFAGSYEAHLYSARLSKYFLKFIFNWYRKHK